MKKFSKILLVSILGVFLVAGSAMAVPFNTNRPYGTQASLTELQEDVFDDIGAFSIDALNDQSTAAIFVPQVGGSSTSTYIASISWWGGGIEFGLYEYGDTSNRLQLFDATAIPTPGDSVSIDFNLGTGLVTAYNFGTGVLTTSTSYFDTFGFYAIAPDMANYHFYSEDDQNPNNYARFLIYEGEGDTVTIPNKPTGGDADHWYVASELGCYGTHGYEGDTWLADFTDFVVVMESIDPVPEPATMLLLGAGLIGLAGMGRKKFFKKS